ncbi:MAG: polyhydroxyalkanoate synthesis regulator DNA-binding domain-containing protein [Candidatus Eisenbacteria bacterium]
MRAIIKHANRRLYDASEGRAITLRDVSELVIGGEFISVVEKVSGEDITVVTLLQSLLERLRRRSSEGLEVREVDRLVAALRKAMATGSGAADTYDSEMEAGSGTSAGTAGGAA